MEPRSGVIFHLSFPVRRLDIALDFYQRCLGATVGRRTHEWADVILFGHQLTLHDQPSQVLPRSARGVRHFGAILPWESWEALRSRIGSYDAAMAERIQHRLAGEPEEHIKLLLEDPDGNLVEIKAYRDPGTIATALA
jgi:extradiol dioxygenase family protein